MNSVPGVITFESKVCDSSLGGSFLPSLSNSSLNLASSAAYQQDNCSKKNNESNVPLFSKFSLLYREIEVEHVSVI